MNAGLEMTRQSSPGYFNMGVRIHLFQKSIGDVIPGF